MYYTIPKNKNMFFFFIIKIANELATILQKSTEYRLPHKRPKSLSQSWKLIIFKLI